MKNSRQVISVVILMALTLIGLGAQTRPKLDRTKDRKVSLILQRLERSSSRFRNSLNSALAQSTVDQTRSENDINAFEPRFENALHQFRSQFDRHLEGVADIEAILGQASLINGFMARNRLNKRALADWTAVRTDLTELANSYSVTWARTRPLHSPTNSSGSLRLSDGDINKLIQRIEMVGDVFRTNLTEAFAQTGYAQAIPEGIINNAVRGFKRETDQLRFQFDNEQQIMRNVELVIARAGPIDEYLRKNQLTKQVQNDWSSLRADIHKLAGAFNLSANWEHLGTGKLQ